MQNRTVALNVLNDEESKNLMMSSSIVLYFSIMSMMCVLYEVWGTSARNFHEVHSLITNTFVA